MSKVNRGWSLAVIGSGLDPYAVLGVPHDASLLDIARARRRLAKRFHPDVAGRDESAQRMQQVNAAWQLLSDPAARHAWDGRQLGAGRTWEYQPRAGAQAPPFRHAGYSPRPRDERSSGRGGWVVLVATSLLLLLIVAGGVVAALDGPSMPGRDSPVLQNNLDRAGD